MGPVEPPTAPRARPLPGLVEPAGGLPSREPGPPPGDAMSVRRMTPGAYQFLEWGQATADPRSRVLDSVGAMIFTGSTVRRAAADDVADPPGRVVELVDVERVRVTWADGSISTEQATVLRAVARP